MSFIKSRLQVYWPQFTLPCGETIGVSWRWKYSTRFADRVITSCPRMLKSGLKSLLDADDTYYHIIATLLSVVSYMESMCVCIKHDNVLFVLYAFFNAFRTKSRRDLLASITLKRPKSFKERLFSMAARFFAQLLDAHFWSMASCSSCFLIAPVPAARGSLVRQRGVRVRCL
jgi:hypothetical protein